MGGESQFVQAVGNQIEEQLLSHQLAIGGQ